MRLGIIAAAEASPSASDPNVGERDATLMRERLALEDLGFVVHTLDPAVDMAEQLDGLLADYAGQLDDVLLYASSLVAVVDDGECFLCLDPAEPDVGDALRDVAGALAQRALGGTLLIVDARFDDPQADRALMQQVVDAIHACAVSDHGPVELIVAARPAGAHLERIPSRLTAALLEAIDGVEGPISAREAYVAAIQAADLGGWPNAVGYVPAAASLQLRDPALTPSMRVPPILAASQPPAAPAPAPASTPAQAAPATSPAPAAATAPATAPAAAVPSSPPAPPAAAAGLRSEALTPVPVPAQPPVDEPSAAPTSEPAVASSQPPAASAPKPPFGEAPAGDGETPTEPIQPVAPVVADAPAAAPADGFDPPPAAAIPEGFGPPSSSNPPAAPAAGFEPPPAAVGAAGTVQPVSGLAPPSSIPTEPPPAKPARRRKRRSRPRRPAPPSERCEVATVSLPVRKKPRPSDFPLPKVVVSARVDPRKKPTLRKIDADGLEVPDFLKETQAEGPAAKRVDGETAPQDSDAPAALDSAIEIDVETELEPVGPPGPAPKRKPPQPEEPPIPSKKLSDWTVEDFIEAGDAQLAAGFVDKALADYKKGLGKLGTATTPVRAEIYVRMAELMRKRGKTRVAISNFEKALAIVADDRRALMGVLELHAEQENWRAVQSVEDRYLDGLTEDDDERLAQLLAFGDRWCEIAKDDKRAKERFLQATKSHPKRIEPLQKLLGIYERQKSLEHVLDTKRRIAALVDDPSKRARVYFELGEYCMFEVSREEDAFAAFELALDSDPTMLEALEVLATALAEHQEWAEIERIYAKMCGVFVERDDEASKVVLAQLYDKQALLYRDHLEDPEMALKALQNELEIVPDRLAARLLAAGVAAELERPAEELVQLRWAAELSPRRLETYQRLFALGQLHDERETSFLAASVCVLLGEASEAQRGVYDEHRVEGVPMHHHPMRPEAWAWLRLRRRDASVDRIMRAVAPAILRVRILQLESDNKLPSLPSAGLQDPKTSTISAVRSLSWGCQYLGMEAPAIYLAEDSDVTLDAPFAKHQSTIIGRGALSGRSMGQLAFLVGRHLALRLPEHELVAHIQSIDEISACFLASLKLVLGQAPPSSVPAKAIDTLASMIEQHQTELEREALDSAVRQFVEANGRVNLTAWVASVELCATRAGYLLCGDLQTAAEVVRKEGDQPFATTEQRIDDLCAFAVSGANLKLRQELGSSIGGSEGLPPLTKR